MFWDARGSHLDFTNPDTSAWWRNRVREAILSYGITSTWNDNNEYALDDEDAVCHGFGMVAPIKLMRPLMGLLMNQASWRAQLDHSQETRPWLISRSGMPGMQRYVQTWSGDNYTEWQTLRYNLQMGLGLGLSGCFNFGHDVGGFAGPPPSPELLVRWLQNGIFHPRFTIHSWNSDGSVTTPWMYPHVIPTVLATIQFRYALLPYLYTLLRAARDSYEPPLRPIFYDYEEDSKAWLPSDDFMCGPSLLVANVMEEGARRRQVYLPENGGRGWYNFHEGTHMDGGQSVNLAAPLNRIPLLVPAGACIPMGEPNARTALDGGEIRYLHVFPLPSGAGFNGVELCYSWTEDDGVSDAEARGEVVIINIAFRGEIEGLYLRASARRPAVEIRGAKAWKPPIKTIQIILPVGETRPVRSTDIDPGFGFELLVGGLPAEPTPRARRE